MRGTVHVQTGDDYILDAEVQRHLRVALAGLRDAVRYQGASKSVTYQTGPVSHITITVTRHDEDD